MKIKLRLEKYYEIFDKLIPENAVVTDIGCGYGPMTFMLSLRSRQREIYAIDYDEEKIDLARNCELAERCNIRFDAADALEYKLHLSDVFLISDMLHYLPSEKQEVLIKKCIDKLNPGGQIIIRDADNQLKKRHTRTVFSEFLSTNIGFNKTKSKLSFFSKSFIEKTAGNNDMELTVIDNARLTSNQIYILKRK
jgi:2-polyprenyl-3-methyl-5-hydroxy-6-metoxy-1,4-benzoquinol methylase